MVELLVNMVINTSCVFCASQKRTWNHTFSTVQKIAAIKLNSKMFEVLVIRTKETQNEKKGSTKSKGRLRQTR